ncbi:MAG: type II toxin-antitoxin system HicB family antitoxin [bacterium]|nr:type II toxin-antitoxin system HicB family antitoxin [bacterium]
MLTEYLAKKLKDAHYKLLKDGSYFGEILGVPGVWASGKNLEACRRELQEVLEEWLVLKVRDRERIPGLRIRVDRRKLLTNA